MRRAALRPTSPTSDEHHTFVASKGKIRVHHGDMNERNDVEIGERVLPGVDLALWLRLVVALLVAVAVAGFTVAVS